MKETWSGSVCLCVMGELEIKQRENWISLKNRLRMLMSFSVLCEKLYKYSPHSCQLSSLLFPVLRSSSSHLFFSHPSLTAVLTFTHFLSLPLICPCLSLISDLLSSPAEAEDHHHLRGGEEVSTQVHHRSKGQHTAGDSGGHRGFCGDAPAGFQLGDHHPEGGARQTGPSAHTGVCKGEGCA